MAKIEKKVVTFISKRFSELRVVLDPQGKKEVSGRLIGFSLDNRFEHHRNGFAADFHDGRFSTDDEAVIEALKAHADYGFMFFSDDESEDKQVTPEVLERLDERKEVADEVAATDPDNLKCQADGCEFVGKNAQSLRMHGKVHEAK